MQRILLMFSLLLSTGAMAQAPPTSTVAQPQQITTDQPFGFPYNTALGTGSEFSVPLRDFLSARIDQLRAELIGIMDERDTRYAQRFEAQNAQVSNALVSAQTAVAKAESATEARFASVNEFRDTLSDQALTFANKETMDSRFTSVENAIDARFNSLEAAVDVIRDRFDASQNRGEGASSLWILIGSAVFLVIAIVTFVAGNIRRVIPVRTKGSSGNEID